MHTLYVKYKNPVAIILLLILFGGAFSYKSLKTSLLPDITFPKIKIIAEAGEQPIDKMMVTVTKPIENAIKQVENLKVIRSSTSMGSCEISAFLEWNTNVDLAIQQSQNRIDQIKNELPANVAIVIEKMNPSILPIMGYSLQSDSKSTIELKLIAEYIVKPYLSRAAGVSSIAVMGGREKEYHIILDAGKLSFYKIDPQLIADAIRQSGFVESQGYTNDFNRLYLAVTDASVKNKEQLEDLVIYADANHSLAVKDIARVEIAERTEYVRIKADGKDVPLIAILKQPASNLIDVAADISVKVDELNKILPAGVSLKPYYNQSEFVQGSLKSIIDVLWIGLILAIVVAIIFLRSFKASSVILVTIPLTLGLTCLVLYAFGFDFNIMTIGAIAASIGLIIDDAIVVVEQIHRTHEEYPHKAPKELVGKAIHFLFPAMVSSSLSTIVILLPFSLMTGVAGAYFKILTETMIITLMASFVITWIGLPVMYLLFSSSKPLAVKKESHSVKQHVWIEFFVRRSYMAWLIILFLIACILFIIPRLETGFLPEMDEGSIVMDYWSPSGTSLDETDRMLNTVDAILKGIPEVETFTRRTGAQMGFFITEPNTGDYLIILRKKRDFTTEEIIDKIRKKTQAALPGLEVDFGQVITDMLGDLMSSVQPIEVKIFGTNDQKLKELSRQVADSIEKVDGTADVFDGIVYTGPIIKTLPIESKLKRFGLTSVDLQSQMQLHLEGTVIGTIPEKEQLTDIRLLFANNSKKSFDELKETAVFLPSGGLLPLSEFADFEIQSGVSEIQRENLQTMGVVDARLNNRDLGSVMKEIRNKLNKISLPPSYQITYGGSYAEQQKSFDELLIILILGALLVFIVILFMFRNLKVSFLVLLLSILGISGSLLALFVTGTPLNVGSYTGMIMIIGIIGENSIFTIQQFFDQLKQGDKYTAITYSISTRLRPKLMTAFGAIVSLTPLALGIGTGAQMHQPLAIAVIGGFIMGLPLLLIVLPSLLVRVVN